MRTYLALFALAAVVTLAITPLIIRLCRRFRLVDRPDRGRKLHARPVPRLGGAGIVLAFLVSLGCMYLYDNAITRHFQAFSGQVGWILLTGLLVFGMGLVDDLRGLRARFKFAAQIVAALLLWGLGFRIENVALPYLGSVHLGVIGGLIVTVLWLVAVTNAFNFIDGMDGLAAGIALFVSLSVLIMALATGNTAIPILAVPLAGALAGFLPYNWNPARIFLGDAGSYFLGFLLGAMAVQCTTKTSTLLAVSVPVAMLGIPLLDTVLAVGRRFVKGQPLFNADGDHIHHRLLRAGLNQRMVVLLLYSLTVLMAVLAMLSLLAGPQPVAVLIPVGMGLLAVLVVRRLGYDEFREVGDMVRKAVRFQRHVIANQVLLRLFQADLRRADTPAALFVRIERLLSDLQFDSMTLRIELGERAERDETANRRIGESAVRSTVSTPSVSEGPLDESANRRIGESATGGDETANRRAGESATADNVAITQGESTMDRVDDDSLEPSNVPTFQHSSGSPLSPRSPIHPFTDSPISPSTDSPIPLSSDSPSAFPAHSPIPRFPDSSSRPTAVSPFRRFAVSPLADSPLADSPALLEWSWSNSDRNGLGDESWTMTIPLKFSGGWRGTVSLVRRLERQRVLFQMATLLDTVSGHLAAGLESLDRDALAAYLAPRENDGTRR